MKVLWTPISLLILISANVVADEWDRAAIQIQRVFRGYASRAENTRLALETLGISE